MTALQQLVDELLDRARREHAGVEYAIVLSNANSLLLPKDGDHLERVVGDVVGSYRGHVYRDAMVEASALGPDFDHIVWLEPVSGPGVDTTPAYRGDLRTQEISAVRRGAS